ncbi:MAG: thioredoxin family protein [Armatimonadetes bacterium]|nr:thioredoxin family protein [Armatimonadota bacterium]
MRQRSLASLLLLLGVLVLPALAEESLWITDFEAAKTRAKADGKLILADFTGSDWCGWCIKLKGEVFDKDEFKAAAPKSFVLLELDFPNKKELPAPLKAQNEKLQAQFKIEGFPTILLLDAEGKAVAKTGYQEGGPEKYIAHLGELVKAAKDVKDLKTKADAAKGVERAKLLDQVVTALDALEVGTEDIPAYSAEIVKLDADGKAGLKKKYAYRAAMDAARALLAADKNEEAKAAFEKAAKLDGVTAEQKQQAMLEEGECFFNTKDFVGLVALLKKALAVDPKSDNAEQIQGLIERFQPEADKQKPK